MPLFAASSGVNAAPPPIINVSPPTITGSPVVGQVLTASQGTWTEKGPNPTFSYQWFDCTGTNCTQIAKAVATTYTVASTDAGHTIEVAVTATNKFATVTASSLPTAVVTSPAPLSPPTHFVSTSTQQTSVATSWTASTSPVTGYTLYRNNSQMTTTTGTSYTFTGLMCGTTYTFAVDAYIGQTHSTQATLSTATAACSTGGTAPVNTVPPAVSGTAQVGSMLTTSNGTWTGTTPMTFTYRWYDCDATGATCTQISTPSSASYTLTSTDLNHTIKAQVTATNTVGSASATSALTAVVKSPPTTGSGLHVVGNQLLGANGNVVHLHGVNRSGTEYACVQGWGIFDGPTDAASIQAIASWHANIVHLGLNEDCILGINGVPAAYSGANYMNAIVSYVNALHAQGLYAEVALMWAAPGTQKAQGHPAILDADHAGAALQAIANAFKGDPNTIIGLTSEPHDISWACWLNGGSSCSVGYTALGMQGALNAVRSTGATNPVTVSGIDYANNLSQWLTYEPVDPAGQLMAEAHIYGKNVCSTTSCFDSQLAPVAAKVPMLWGETGETYDDSDCGSSYISTFLTWADAHGVGYEAWTWDTWGTCGSLISNYNGTPANAYGTYVRNHFLSLP